MAKTTWVLEPSHSELEFKIRHFMISTVSGQFHKFDATVETEGDDFSTAKISLTAEIDSISTRNDQRDGHLKSADFFDMANHPQIKFESTGFQKASDDQYKLTGNLTMHGVTHPVSLDVEYGGTMKDPYGNTRSGFVVEGKLIRKDWGLVYNGTTEAGGLVLGEDVKIHASVEFVKS
jgi:polyisoprenoid-binding protein YceI